jgi:hypothetical protein
MPKERESYDKLWTGGQTGHKCKNKHLHLQQEPNPDSMSISLQPNHYIEPANSYKCKYMTKFISKNIQ